MHESRHFALLVLAAAGAGMLAVLATRITDRLRVPAPAVVLIVAAIAQQLLTSLQEPSLRVVDDLVTVALVVILFDGGMKLGWRRVRTSAPTIASLGVVGTFLTAGAAAVLLHVAFGLDAYAALLVGTAVAPTDPAVVFSVLGQRQIVGDAGTVLAGESGANDPVGIALLASLLAAGRLDPGAIGVIAAHFLEQMVIGGAVGLAAGWLLLVAVRRVGLSAGSLHALLLLAGTLLCYGVATQAHGSGFLAVFVAGIALGDARLPYRSEVRQFQDTLASLGEIVAFVVLGVTVDVGRIVHPDVWVPGVLLGLALALVIRPLLGGLCLLGSPLTSRERTFVLAVGLKGAVPILLGSMLLSTSLAHAGRYYAIVVVAVLVSMLGQGTLVPTAARLLKIPMRPVDRDPGAQSGM